MNGDGKDDAWRLAAANAILALCRAKKTRLADHFQAVCRGRNAKDNLEIPDYALDKHTRRGKEMNRGFEHFRQEGSKLENLATDVPDTYEDEAYTIWESGILEGDAEKAKEKKALKREQPSKKQERNLFEF